MRRKNKKKLYLIIGFVVVTLFGILLIDVIKFAPILFELLFKKEIVLKKSDNRINVLLMGVGGGTHDGPELTDTIIMASINQDTNKVNLVSLPRDLWIPELKGRINNAYASGNSKQKGGGLVLSKAIVSRILGQRIDYALVVDFNGFVKAVDLVGGLDIEVDRTFDDYEYPIEEKKEDLCDRSLEEATELIASQSAREVFPCRYQHVHFDQGSQHMDGSRALLFVRPRYAIGVEGTDFARSMRQQKVIKAFREKIFSLGTLLNPLKVTQLYNVLAGSIDTDIQTNEFDDFIKLAQKMQDAQLESTVLEAEDPSENKKGVFKNPPLDQYNGAWVLVPRAGVGNYSEIQSYVTCVLTSSQCQIK